MAPSSGLGGILACTVACLASCLALGADAFSVEEFGADSRLWHLKTVARSQCLRAVRFHGVTKHSGIGSPVHWRTLANTVESKLRGVGYRYGWRRFGGLALEHHMCQRRSTNLDDCIANSEVCPLGAMVGHVLMLLSHPESYAFDLRLLDSHEQVHRWEILGASLGYFIWNLPGVRLLDVLYSGWPVFKLLRALRSHFWRFKGQGTLAALEFAKQLHAAKNTRDAADRTGSLNRLDVDYLSAISLCKIVPSHGMENWTGSCPLAQAHQALEAAEVAVKQADLEEMERCVETAHQHLKEFLWWFQPPNEGWKAPAARISTLMLVASDCLLPILSRLQKHINRRLQIRAVMQPPQDTGAAGVPVSICPAHPEQGILSSEAAYIKDFHDVLHEMDSFGQSAMKFQPKANETSKEACCSRFQPWQAWVAFLWGGTSASAVKAAALNSEVIRTMAYSVRKWEAARRTFLVLTVGQVPEVLIAELQAEGLEVRSVRNNETLPMWQSTYIRKPKHVGDWFSDRGLKRSFAQLAAWTLTEFERVVILDGDTLMLRSCDELFRLPTLLAAAPEMHRDQEDIGNLDREGRTYLLNAGVMFLRPNLFTFMRTKAMVATEHFRYLAEKIGVMGEANFQSLTDTYLAAENFWRVGSVLWDDQGRFEGCLIRGTSVRSARNIITAWKATGKIHCLLPIDYNFCADFPHVFFSSWDFLTHEKGRKNTSSVNEANQRQRKSLMRETVKWYRDMGWLRGTPKIVHFPGHLRKPWQRWLPLARSPWDELWWQAHDAMCAAQKAPCRLSCEVWV
ncbi:unnamed protein product [Durusdinium trenchii]|uniref:Uncharacterized protein n=3 Tax=Durusdinium trenchii TaxID=1381693 RepID=A0ABP0QM34_9DINO